MDKLRAIANFLQVTESGSFGAAARSLKVTHAALAKSVTGLEHELGTTLLRRTVRGVSLTADGERYHKVARKLLGEMDSLEETIHPRDGKPRGAVRVGVRSLIAERCVLPWISRFLANYPGVEVFPQRITMLDEVNQDNLDIAILPGWATRPDFIVMRLLQTRHVICASPEYLQRAGIPREPEDLQHHQCLPILSCTGVFMDRWTFERAGERRTVTVKGRLNASEGKWVEEAARGGAGIARLTDIGVSPALASGLLVPVLVDWTATEAPTITAVYWRSNRRSRLVHVFLDFLREVFGEIHAKIPQSAPNTIHPVHRPAWFGRVHGRLSQPLPPLPRPFNAPTQ